MLDSTYFDAQTIKKATISMDGCFCHETWRFHILLCLNLRGRNKRLLISSGDHIS